MQQSYFIGYIFSLLIRLSILFYRPHFYSITVSLLYRLYLSPDIFLDVFSSKIFNFYYLAPRISKFTELFIDLPKLQTRVLNSQVNFHSYYTYVSPLSLAHLSVFYKRFWEPTLLTTGLLNMGVSYYILTTLLYYSITEGGNPWDLQYFSEQLPTPNIQTLTYQPKVTWTINYHKPLLKLLRSSRQFYWVYFRKAIIRRGRYLSFLRRFKVKGAQPWLEKELYLQIFRSLGVVVSQYQLLFFKNQGLLYHNKQPLYTFKRLVVGDCLSLGYGFYFQTYFYTLKYLEQKYYNYFLNWSWKNSHVLGQEAFASDKLLFTSYFNYFAAKPQRAQQSLFFDLTLGVVVLLDLRYFIEQQLQFYFFKNHQLRISAWRY